MGAAFSRDHSCVVLNTLSLTSCSCVGSKYTARHVNRLHTHISSRYKLLHKLSAEVKVSQNPHRLFFFLVASACLGPQHVWSHSKLRCIFVLGPGWIYLVTTFSEKEVLSFHMKRSIVPLHLFHKCLFRFWFSKMYFSTLWDDIWLKASCPIIKPHLVQDERSSNICAVFPAFLMTPRLEWCVYSVTDWGLP